MLKIIRIIFLGCVICCSAACTPPKQYVSSGFGNPAHPQLSTLYTENIWNTLASQFNLPDETAANPEVRKQINWYLHNQKHLVKIAKRAEPYLYYISQQVKQRNLPAELTLLPIIESEYEPLAYSKVGAAGLWQIMPGTASGFGLKIDWWYDGRRDIIASTNAALDLFAYLGNFFNNDWLLAIAAYDTGDGMVDAAIRQNAKLGKPVDFWHLPLYKETKSYVPKLLALATIIKNPYKYKIDLPPIKNIPYLTEVDVGSPINLATAAKMAEISLPTLIKLNPGYNRWTTDPNGKHKLLLPIDKAARFKEKLAHLPKSERVTWARYKIKKGDSLLAIAHRFKTSTVLLRHVNQLHSNNLHINQALLIPTKTDKLTQAILDAEKNAFTLKKGIPDVKITKHQIKHGDNLWGIAKKYHVKPKEILFWNGLKNRKQLKVGKNLIIWPHRRHLKIVTKNTHYRVKIGDSLGIIAQRFNTTITTLKKLNHLKNNTIHPKQILIVQHRRITITKSPRKLARHTTQPYKKLHRIIYHAHAGDTLSHIANRYHIKVADIKSWNKIDNPNQLHAHQRLVIYI